MWLPPISFYAFWHQTSSICHFEAFEHYQKKSFRNRIFLAGAEKNHSLSVPLKKGKHQNTAIQNVEIFWQSSWPRNHLRTIQTNYRSAAFFDFYFDEIRDLYHKKEKYLWQWNLNFLKWSTEKLGLNLDYQFTSQYEHVLHHELDMRNIQNQLSLKGYRKNPQYWYPQVFEEKRGFTNDLSILDLIMNTGPEARLYLNNYWQL